MPHVCLGTVTETTDSVMPLRDLFAKLSQTFSALSQLGFQSAVFWKSTGLGTVGWAVLTTFSSLSCHIVAQ